MSTAAVALLARESGSLLARVRGFSTTRWAAGALSGSGSRADAAYALGCQLAAAGRAAGLDSPELPPPRPKDHALADLLAVLVADLLSAPGVDQVAPRALAAVLAARTALDGSVPPPDAVAAAAGPAG